MPGGRRIIIDEGSPFHLGSEHAVNLEGKLYRTAEEALVMLILKRPDTHPLDLTKQICMNKCITNPAVERALVETGDAEIVNERDPNNILGLAWMAVRGEL